MDIPLVDQRSQENKVLKQVKKKVPILTWLPKYNVDSAVSDVIAGVTVGLTVIPQVGFLKFHIDTVNILCYVGWNKLSPTNCLQNISLMGGFENLYQTKPPISHQWKQLI